MSIMSLVLEPFLVVTIASRYVSVVSPFGRYATTRSFVHPATTSSTSTVPCEPASTARPVAVPKLWPMTVTVDVA